MCRVQDDELSDYFADGVVRREVIRAFVRPHALLPSATRGLSVAINTRAARDKTNKQRRSVSAHIQRYWLATLRRSRRDDSNDPLCSGPHCRMPAACGGGGKSARRASFVARRTKHAPAAECRRIIIVSLFFTDGELFEANCDHQI